MEIRSLAVIVLVGAAVSVGCGGGSSGPPGGRGGGAGASGPGGGGVAGAAAGSNGTAGATAVAGSNGTAGATAVAGSNGAAGATAAAGSNGTAGATAVAGSNGAAGATAVAGSNGAAGATAVAGSNGAAGATGGSGGGGVTARAGCDPDWVIYDFTGTVREAWDPRPKGSPFAVGAPVTGYYCFDLATVDVTESPDSTYYYFERFTNELHGRPAPRFVFSLSLGALVFTTNPKNLYSSIIVTDGAERDSFYLHPMEMLVNVASARIVSTDLFAFVTDTSTSAGTELVIGALEFERYDDREIRIALDAASAHARWDTLTRVH